MVCYTLNFDLISKNTFTNSHILASCYSTLAPKPCGTRNTHAVTTLCSCVSVQLRWSKPNTYGSHAAVMLVVSLVWHSYSEICRFLLLLNDFQTSSTLTYVLYYNRGSEDSLHMSEFFLLVATLWVRDLRRLLVQVVLEALLWSFAWYFTPSVFFRRALISLPVGFDPFFCRYSM